MNPLAASQIAEILSSRVSAGDPTALITTGVATDTRKLTPGSAFFALQGENFDGDTFAPAALAAGAVLVVVRKWTGTCPPGAAVIETPNPLLALQRLACWWRKQLDLPVVAITGSNGKTSAKDFTAAVLARKFRVSATVGNLNNHIGVPLSVLATTPDHQAAVWEMGMNHAGELAPLCEIAKPKFGIITHIGSAHIEHLGSREAIAAEKATLARCLPQDGLLFLPATSDFHDFLRQRTKAGIISVGNGRGLVRAENLRPTDSGTCFTLVIQDLGETEVSLPVPGRHMVTNALLAAAVGWKLGVTLDEIAAGLASSSLTHGRLQRRDFHGITLIDDTYNANPESMLAALDTLAETPAPATARRIAVLGRMGELGPHAPAAHLRIGQAAAAHGHVVIAAGPGSEGIADGAKSPHHFPELEDAARWLASNTSPGDVVLFKGSRTSTIEKVLQSAFPGN